MSDMKLDPIAKDLALDSTGNIKFTQTFAELVAQRIQCRLSTFRGEWFLDRNLGVPFFEEVFKVAPDVNRVRNLLLSEAVTVPGVKEITSFVARFDNETRTFSLQFSALCTDGTIAEGEI